MAKIVLADDGIEFDGNTLEERALGGVESSFVMLARTLAARGHEVHVRNMCAEAKVIDGVDWQPIHDGGAYANMPEQADLYIANRGDKLIDLMPGAGRTLFWIHNPADYLLKFRYIKKLWKVRPTIVFIGDYHAETCPKWVPDGGRMVIPYGVPDAFREATPGSGVPGPRAVFTSNPLRSLDWLLERWSEDIQPKVPGAELHLFTGAATYGSVGDRKAEEMARVVAKAESLADQGVVVRGPVPKAQLIEEFRDARAMLYRGDFNETYCLALAEAQAMGVPCVVENLGSTVERVIDGETGFVATTDVAFSRGAIKLLSDDVLWQAQHNTALERQRAWGWDQAADSFERLIL